MAQKSLAASGRRTKGNPSGAVKFMLRRFEEQGERNGSSLTSPIVVADGPGAANVGIPSHSPLDRCESRELQLFHGVPNLGHDLRLAHGPNVGRGARDGNRSRPHPTEIPQRASITAHISPPRSEITSLDTPKRGSSWK